MHSLCKNENIPMWGKHIAARQKKLLSTLPGSLLKSTTSALKYFDESYPRRMLIEGAKVADVSVTL